LIRRKPDPGPQSGASEPGQRAGVGYPGLVNGHRFNLHQRRPARRS